MRQPPSSPEFGKYRHSHKGHRIFVVAEIEVDSDALEMEAQLLEHVDALRMNARKTTSLIFPYVLLYLPATNFTAAIDEPSPASPKVGKHRHSHKRHRIFVVAEIEAGALEAEAQALEDFVDILRLRRCRRRRSD